MTRRASPFVLAALVLTLSLAGTASANSISLAWISTSGPGTGVGTGTLTGVLPGDTSVLEIRFTATNVNAVAMSYGYNTGVIDTVNGLADLVVCPVSVANPFGPGVCGRATAEFGTVGIPSLLAENAALSGTGGGTTSAAALAGALEGQTAGTFELAQITFTAIGPGTTGAGFYRPGADGVRTIQGAFQMPAISGGSITVIPEPGTVALLALGLVVLGVRRRA